MRTAMLGLFCLVFSVVLVAGGTSAPAEAVAAATALHPDVIAKVALARVATAKYVTNLELAKADGYRIITPMIPNMGYHYLNPKIEGFDVARPPILVYVRTGDGYSTPTGTGPGLERLPERALWQLVAVEWVFPKRPATVLLRGARYGSFGAACHYADGSFVMAGAQRACASNNPKTGAAFGFWHPSLVTLHLWIWYPNPDGMFGEFNPYLSSFNND